MGGECLDKETRAQKQTLSGEFLSSHFDVCETDVAQSHVQSLQPRTMAFSLKFNKQTNRAELLECILLNQHNGQIL